MATIKGLYECPNCKETITASRRPDKCPNTKCGYDFGEAVNEYKYPVTLHEQLQRMLTKHAHYDSIIGMPIEKANHIINDALNIIETLPAKNVRKPDIRYLVKMAIKIGQIATKYEEYLEAGGAHVPSLFFKEGEENVVPKTPNGKGPTGGVT